MTDPGVVIVLAEPGAGKTELLNGIAKRLGVNRLRASVARPSANAGILVVDAFDEVARVGEGPVRDILLKLQEAGPSRVLLSSRSGEWEEARTGFVRDLFGQKPQVAYLVPLDRNEQRQLFEHLHPDRSIADFLSNIQRFELHHLLGNPEFLRLFASAFDESDGEIVSRSDIFALALRNLARESNRDVMTSGVPSWEMRLRWAEETFAKLLLAGADGIAVGDLAEDGQFPQLETIMVSDEGASSILGTKMFRPGAAENQHEPVHRIVAEYAGAKHLAVKVDDATHRLSIEQCLALLAPNNTTRDDLRGLMGWFAALGSQNVQDAVIDIDPYAVLANGGPVPFMCRPKCSFRPLSVRRRRGFSSLMLSVAGADCRSR